MGKQLTRVVVIVALLILCQAALGRKVRVHIDDGFGGSGGVDGDAEDAEVGDVDDGRVWAMLCMSGHETKGKGPRLGVGYGFLFAFRRAG